MDVDADGDKGSFDFSAGDVVALINNTNELLSTTPFSSFTAAAAKASINSNGTSGKIRLTVEAMSYLSTNPLLCLSILSNSIGMSDPSTAKHAAL